MSISMFALENFTVFEQARFELSPGVNVLIGENGTGKTHVLKALYAVTRELHRDPDALWTVHSALSEVFVCRDPHEHLRRRGTSDACLIKGKSSEGTGFYFELHPDGLGSAGQRVN